jgi:hypothetical protein
MAQINEAIQNRSAVRISERNGYHKGLTGIALGYNSSYGSIKVGFVDADGKYNGDYTTVAAEHVELVSEEAPAEVSGVARILRELDELNREVESTLTWPSDIVDVEGRVWTYRDGLYRNGVSVVPKEMIRTAHVPARRNGGLSTE